MPAWIYVLAAAAVLFVAWFAFARRWVHALWYSWARARHLADLTQTEVIPGAEFLGSMMLDDDPHGEQIAARALRYGDIWAGPDGRGWHEVTGDWREQTAAELSPEALNPAGFLRGLDRVLGSITTTSPPPADPEDYDPELDEPFRWLPVPPLDPGPGDALVSSSPSPGPDQSFPVAFESRSSSAGIAAGALQVAPAIPCREPSRLADTGDLAAAREAHPAPDWLEGQLADLYGWVRAMVPQVTGWERGRVSYDLTGDLWVCEDCGWQWPLADWHEGAECDACGGEMHKLTPEET